MINDAVCDNNKKTHTTENVILIRIIMSNVLKYNYYYYYRQHERKLFSFHIIQRMKNQESQSNSLDPRNSKRKPKQPKIDIKKKKIKQNNAFVK